MKQNQPPPAKVVRPGWVFRVAVCLVSGAYCRYFAEFSALAYGIHNIVHGTHRNLARLELALIVFGPVAGVLAGVVWCLLMDDRARRAAEAPGRSAWIGAGKGALVGLGASMVVHASLMVATREFEPFLALVGAVFGLGAGAFLGMILGWLWYPAQRWRQRRLSGGGAGPTTTDNPPSEPSE